MSEVRLVGIVKRFGASDVVRDVSLSAPNGKVTTLLGPSGCGKTTLLRMIAGLERPDQGEIWIGDTLVCAPKKNLFTPPNERNVGMVFQSYAIWPHRTVAENLGYPLEIRGTPAAERARNVREICELLRLDGLLERYPGQLSGGQQQRVALGRALIYRPRLLLLDEPLANLDVKIREVVRLELKALQMQLGFTAIYVTHDQAEAMVLSDHLLVLNGGVIERQGTPAEVYTDPRSRFVAEFIGQSNFFDAMIVDVENGKVVAQPAAGGRLTVSSAQSHRVGEKRVLSVRPEDIAVAAADNAVWLRGKVVTKAFFGNMTFYRVATPLGELTVQSNAWSTPSLDVGRPVDLSLREEGLRLLER